MIPNDQSMLAVRTVMGTAPSNRDPLDRRLAGAAGLTGALVYVVLQLEEAAHAVRIDVVGYRGTAEADGML